VICIAARVLPHRTFKGSGRTFGSKNAQVYKHVESVEIKAAKEKVARHTL